MIDLNKARRVIQSAGTKAINGERFKVIFQGAGGFVTTINELKIPSFLPSGVYTAQVVSVSEDDEEKEVSKINFEIPQKEQVQEQEILPTPKIENSNDSTSLLLQLRSQDQMAFEREREHFREQSRLKDDNHRIEIESIRREHKAELEREKQKYEFQLDLLKSNQVSLEEDRKRVTEAIEKRIRAEARKPVEDNTLSTLLNNPLAVSLFGKILGIDTGAMDTNALMDALKNFTPANGAGA